MNCNNENCANTSIEDYSWYVGEMDRREANKLLSRFPIGTFLIRLRAGMEKSQGYALSLRSEDDVKHMKIMSYGDLTTNNQSEINNEVEYYLSEKRKFKSIVKLVEWFCQRSLKENLRWWLDTTLTYPIPFNPGDKV